MNAEKILKHAFIDTFCHPNAITEYTFSNDFEYKMHKLIKKQKSVIKLLNTSAKRVAIILLITLTVITSTLFSVSAVRNPILDTIKNFFVDAKQMLNNTLARDISQIFPEKITEIIITSHISETLNQYKIKDEEAIEKFIKLISNTHWEHTDNKEEFTNTNPYWSFDIYEKDKKSITIKICELKSQSSSLVSITKNDKTDYYYIDSQISDEILSFTNKKYYLHNSDLEKPSADFCKSKKSAVENGLAEGEILAISNSIRNAHYLSEDFLMSTVKYLKESNSIYWDYVISGEEFTDPITNETDSFYHNKTITDELSFIIHTVKDEKTNKKLFQALKLWQDGMESHELENLLKAHEILHDFDYYLFNYPTVAVYSEFADFQGLNDYFGHIS